MAPHQTRLACVVVAVFLGRRAGASTPRSIWDGCDWVRSNKCWAVCHAKYGDALASVDIDEHEGGSGRCDCCCQTECTCLRGRGIESFALPAGSEKPGACGDSGPADGAETPPSSPGDGKSSDGAAHAAATSVLVGLVAAFAV